MSTPTSTGGFVIGSKLYDKIKFVVQILIPALITLYTFLGTTWHWPDVKEVVGSLSAIALFLGSAAHISSANYTPPSKTGTPDGNFNVVTLPDGKKSVTLSFDQDPATLIDGRVLTFEVKEDGQPADGSDPNEPREENLS
jgi:hypothetical protein